MLTAAAFTWGIAHTAAPVARAGHPLRAHPAEGHTLSATSPGKPEGDQNVSAWLQTGGPEATPGDSAGPTAPGCHQSHLGVAAGGQRSAAGCVAVTGAGPGVGGHAAGSTPGCSTAPAEAALAPRTTPIVALACRHRGA